MHDIPRVTPHVFTHEVRPILMSRGLNEHQINQVELAFHDSLVPIAGLPSWHVGIDRTNIEQKIDFMKEHHGTTALDAHHWDVVQDVLSHHVH